MRRHRRHANDFTDSLNSFYNTKSDIDPNTLESISCDSLEENAIRNNRAYKAAAHSTKHSTILAGNSANVSAIQAVSDSSVILQSLNHIDQDINKQINLFETTDSEEKFQHNDIPDSCMKADDDKENSKFESILCSLDNELNSMKEMSHPQKVLTRLFGVYMDSPKNFTDKLLTIIEESIANNDNYTCNNTSAINLSRLTTEFRKMCKFIEDESPPKWPQSMIMFSPENVLKSPVYNETAHSNTNKNEKLTSPKNICLPSTPISGIEIIKRRLFQKMSKDDCKRKGDKTLNVSMNEFSDASFERLEAHCKKLYPEEKEYAKSLRKSMSVPSLVRMSQMKDICEKQMASLSNSVDDINSSLDSGCAIDFHYARTQPELHRKLFQRDKISYSKTKSIRTNEKFDLQKEKANNVTNDFTKFDPDELEKTLMQDIAEKRKRCLDTARLIAKINADPEAIQVKKSLGVSPTSPNNEQHSMSNHEANFLKTLMSCKNYQTYLEKQEPLFNFLQNSNSSLTEKIILEDDEKNSMQHEKVKNVEKEALNTRKLSSIKSAVQSRNVRPHNSSKTPSSVMKDDKFKSKFFATPGKTPPIKACKNKKIYFPAMHSPYKDTLGKNTVRSPHAEGLYSSNYNTVVSPVGMYIRGTDTRLIKNVHAKPDDLLLTPIKKNTTPNKNSKQCTSAEEVKRSEKNKSLREHLSPNVRANEACNKEINSSKTSENTPKSLFKLPKVTYKLPLQVKTFKENEPPKTGARVKKLLESTRSKVIIRHEGRTNSGLKMERTKLAANDDTLEINYEPEDESIHVEQAATKTNFIHRAKYI